MTAKQTAAKIYRVNKSDQERILSLIDIVGFLEGQDASQVKLEYRKILEGKLKVVEVTTSFPLSDDEISTLEQKVNKQPNHKELIFDYVVDENIRSGIEIKLDDTLIDLEK